MLSNNNFKAVCSVTELAKKLDLSRARFYQLQKMGILPEPVYCIHTRRPFYPMDLQEKCLEVRKTGIGYNGRSIIFYSKRISTSRKPQNDRGQKYKELADTLKQMGLKITVSEAKNAINTLYPQGTADNDDGVIIRNLFRYFRQGV